MDENQTYAALKLKEIGLGISGGSRYGEGEKRSVLAVNNGKQKDYGYYFVSYKK